MPAPKFVFGGDAHIRAGSPEKRRDDFHAAQLKKLAHVIDYSLNNGISAIVLPGDIFDTSKTPYWVVYEYIKLLALDPMWALPKVLIVLGQHDQVYHTSGYCNTPVGLLAAAVDRITILGETPTNVGGVDFYGASWGEEVPDPVSDGVNVLVTHRMVVKEKLWADQTDFVYGHTFLDEMVAKGYTTVVCGDNHQHFTVSSNKKHLVNCGSLMRSTIAQVDHVPCFYTWSPGATRLGFHEIPHAPSEEVFDLEAVEREKENQAELDAFANSLYGDYLAGMSFKARLAKALEQEEVESDVADMIRNAMGVA